MTPIGIFLIILLVFISLKYMHMDWIFFDILMILDRHGFHIPGNPDEVQLMKLIPVLEGMLVVLL